MIRVRHAVLIGVVLTSLVGVSATPVRAVELADRAYEEGKAALRVRQLDVAIDAFSRALSLAEDEPEAWRALLGLALAYELSGDTLRGAVYYRQFLGRSAPSPLAAGSEWGPRRVEAASSAERLERSLLVTHAHIAITSDPPGSAVVITPPPPGECMRTPCTIFAPPGRYTIAIMDSDRHVDERVIDAIAGRRHEVAVDLRPAPIVLPRSPPEPAGWPPAATWTLVGGGAALVTGAIFTGLAAGDHDDLEALSGMPGSDDVLARYDATRSRLESRETSAWVCYIVGGVAIVTGLVLGLSAPSSPDRLTLRF